MLYKARGKDKSGKLSSSHTGSIYSRNFPTLHNPWRNKKKAPNVEKLCSSTRKTENVYLLAEDSEIRIYGEFDLKRPKIPFEGQVDL